MSKGEITTGGGETADLALAQRRSRSRGRTPSELLARKQRLASAGRMPLDNADQQDQRQTLASGGGGNQNEGDYQPLSAEAKLESLSALLRHHQVSSAELSGNSDETTTTMATNQHQQEQLKSVDDVYILLAKKEKDLQLAAELGKVLLERNEDLSRANERIAEEYSHKLELLEQEKHKLKRKLDQLDGEYENRLIELQTDCNILKNKLEQQQQAGKQAEKEKSKLIEDLVQQNQRLTSELAEATRSEELLASQLEQVNERLSSRLSNRSNHVAQVDALQEEIQILNQRKQDLERRLKLAQGDKSQLKGVIDELGDKIQLCENLLNEKDLKIGELVIEISELRDSSAWLSARLESMISLNERLVASVDVNSNVGNGEHNVAADLTAISERDRSQLVEQLKELRLRRSSRIKANELILAEAEERRRRSLMKPTARLRGSRARRQRAGQNNDENDDDSATMSDNELDLDDPEALTPDESQATTQNLSELISEIFFILSNFLAALQQRKESLQISAGGSGGSTSSHHQSNGQNQQHNLNEDSGIGSTVDELGAQQLFQRSAGHSTGDKSISLSLAQTTSSTTTSNRMNDLEQWRRLINEVRQLIEELPCSNCQLMIGERSDFEQLRRAHTKLNEEIRLKNDELLELNGQNIELSSQLSVLQDKCRLLKEELESCDRPTDEIVKQAWKTRDEAVSRKNNAEIQLAKTRIENMQVSSQLMEVVQQKGELSQKLAQFEDDIHYMMQRSVRQRFSWEEYAQETRRLGGGQSRSRQSDGTNKVRMTTANQLINLVPSIVSSNAQGSSSIQQLLSLTGVSLLTPTKTKRTDESSSQDATSNGSIGTSSSQLGGLGEQNKLAPAATQNNLFSSLKSGTNRFNLRFWQRNSSSQDSDQTPDKMIADSAES